MTTKQITVNATRCDWVRLASYNWLASVEIRRRIAGRPNVGLKEPWRWLQYRGSKYKTGIRYGEGQQKGRPHFILECSGENAHDFLKWWLSLPEPVTRSFYATRIDLQRTQKTPEKDDRLTVYKRLRGAKQLIQSETGTTLYIGARTSHTFWRLYDKAPGWLRVELELKDVQAKKSYVALTLGESLDNLWNRFLKRSRVPQLYVSEFWSNGEDDCDLPDIPKIENENIGKLEWFAKLDGLAYKLANDHDTAERFASLIKRWAEYGHNVDT